MTDPATTPAALLPGYTYFPQTGPGDDAALLADVVAALQDLRRKIEIPSGEPSRTATAEQKGAQPAKPLPEETGETPKVRAEGGSARIRFSWREADGRDRWGELRVESVKPHPLRGGTVLVTGRWPTGQEAEWEIAADEAKWGRGTEVKLRWAAGPDGSPMQAGIFGIVEVTTRPDGLRALVGLWPDGSGGVIELPRSWAHEAKGPE